MFDVNIHFNSFKSYLVFYGLKIAAVRHEFVLFKSNGFELAGHIFKPVDYKATVVILHGYLNHCGLLAKLIKYLTETGFAVACFDLPGHGLSEGKRAAIEDFSEYGKVLNDFMQIVRTQMHGPYHIVAHSTGASAVMENLFTNGEDLFDKIVLVAPLVRCGFWRPVQAVRWMFGPCGAVPRIFVKNSSNWRYLAFILFKDPLQARTVSVKWLRAMYRWDKRAAQYSALPRQVKIIQGSRDMTVDWRYNIGFIRDKFAKVDVTMIKGGDHELLNESEAIRSKVYEYISKYLQE